MHTEELGRKYQILEEFSSDTLGKNLKIRDKERDVLLSAKLLKDQFFADPRARATVKSALEARKDLEHPNLSPIIDVGEVSVADSKSLYVVSELISGPSLSKYLRQKAPLPLVETLRLAGELCQGLAFAHGRGFWHGNLNPNTVTLSGGRTVKICELGVFQELNKVHTQLKTPVRARPGYMAPEQMKKEAQRILSEAVDIYSLGSLLYEMSTGQKTFAGDTPMEILNKQIRSKFKRPSEVIADIPPLLESLILACLQASPAKRPDSAMRVFGYLDKIYRSDCSPKEGARQPKPSQQQPKAPQPPPQQQPKTPQPPPQQQPKPPQPPPQQQPKAPQPPPQQQPKPPKPPPQQQEKIDLSIPPRRSRPLLRSIAYAGMLASLMAISALSLFDFKIPELKTPPIKQEAEKEGLHNFSIRRPRLETLEIRWHSSEEYQAQMSLKRRSRDMKSSINRRRVIQESEARRSHELNYEGLHFGEVYDLSIIRVDSGKEIHRSVVFGSPRLLSGPFVYPRRGSADIDWVSNVHLKDSFVTLVDGDSRKEDSFKARQSKVDDDSYRYSATIIAPGESKIRFKLAKLGKQDRVFSAKLGLKHVIETKPSIRPVFSLNENREFLDALTLEDPSLAEKVRSTLPSWAKRELKQLERSHFPDIIAGPLLVGRDLVFGDQGGCIFALSIPENDYSIENEDLNLSWVYFDPAANYGETRILAKGKKEQSAMLWAQLSRSRLTPPPLLSNDEELIEAYEVRGKKLMAKAFEKDERRESDLSLLLNPQKRRGDWQERSAGRVLQEIRHDREVRKTQRTWGEEDSPVYFTHSLENRQSIKSWGSRVRACQAKDSKEIAAVVYADWLEEGQYVLQSLDPSKEGARWSAAMDDLGKFPEKPICHDEVVYLRCLSEQVSEISELAEAKSSFLRAFDLQSRKSWRFDTTGTLQFTRLFFDDYRGRLYFSDHENVYCLDHRLRRELLRKGAKLPRGLINSSNEFKIPLSSMTRFLPRPPGRRKIGEQGENYIVSTPAIFAPRYAPKEREMMLLCLLRRHEIKTSPRRPLIQQKRSFFRLEMFLFALGPKTLARRLPVMAQRAEDFLILSKRPKLANLQHFCDQGENGILLYALSGRVFVFDLNKEPSVDLLTKEQRHIVIDQSLTGRDFRSMALEGNSIYLADFKGRLSRFAFSPTKIPMAREREALPVDNGLAGSPGETDIMEALQERKGPDIRSSDEEATSLPRRGDPGELEYERRLNIGDENEEEEEKRQDYDG